MPEASSLAGRKLEADLALRWSLGNHELLDGIHDFLNRGVVGFETPIQLVYFCRELAVLGQHFAHANEGTNHEDAHLNGPLGIEHGCGHDRTVLSERVGWIAAPATAFL